MSSAAELEMTRVHSVWIGVRARASRDVHHKAVRPGTKLADQLPPFLDVEYLAERRHERMVAPARGS